MRGAHCALGGGLGRLLGVQALLAQNPGVQGAVLTTGSGEIVTGCYWQSRVAHDILLSHNIFKAKSQPENAQKKSRHMKNIGGVSVSNLEPAARLITL